MHAVGGLRPRPSRSSVNWNPFVNRADDAAGGARRVVRHVLLRDRQPLLRGRLREPRTHAAVGAQVRLRRSRPGSTSAARPRASSRRRSGARRPSRATGTAPGTPATRSSSRSARRTCSSRRSRWPRSTRCSRTAARSSRRISCRTSSSPARRARRGSFSAGSRRARRSRRASTRLRSRPCATASTPRRTPTAGTSSGVFASYPVPISGKTGTAEKVVPLPGYPSRPPRGPVVVVRLGPVGRRADRRLRADRERRPRLGRGRAGRAEGLRALLRRRSAAEPALRS